MSMSANHPMVVGMRAIPPQYPQPNFFGSDPSRPAYRFTTRSNAATGSLAISGAY